MVNPNALMTVAEVSSVIQETANKSTFELEMRINALSNTFENYTSIRFVERQILGYRVDGPTYAVRTAGWGFNTFDYFLIPLIPVRAIQRIRMHYAIDDLLSVTITDPSRWLIKGGDEWAAVSSIGFHSWTGRVELLQDAVLAGKENIEVDMTVGCSKNHPYVSEARRLMIMQLNYEYHRFVNNEEGVAAHSMTDGSYSFAPVTNLLKEVSDGLDAMRQKRFV